MTRLLHPLRALVTVALVAGGMLALSGPAQAQSGAQSGAQATSAAPPGKAWVRVAHFVPGMGAASIALTPVDGATQPAMTANGASYGEVTAYDKLTPGTYTATVRKDGAGSGDPMLSRSVKLTGGEARTIAVLGTSDQPRLVLLKDDLTPPKAGTARVRLLSASDAARAISVKAVDGPTLAEDTVLGETTPYTTVPDGAWDLRLSSTGAGNSDSTVRLASGSVYTVVALDAGAGVKLDVVTDAAGAMSTPQGGADTGLGGTAGSSSYSDQGDLGSVARLPASTQGASSGWTTALALTAPALLIAAGLLLVAPAVRRRRRGDVSR